MIVDAAIIAVTGFFAWRGYRRGLLSWLVRFAGFIAAVFTAVYLYKPIGATLHAVGFARGVGNIVGAIAIFIAVSSLFWIAGRALYKVLDWSKWGKVNKLGGAALASAWTLSWVMVLVLALSVAPAPAAQRAIRGSTLASGMVRDAPAFATAIAHTNLRALIDSFVPSAGDQVMVAATTDFADAPGSARTLFDLLNDARRAFKLKPLFWDESLAAAARDHVADMYRRGYFSHRTPEGLTPAGRLRALHIAFAECSENLALGPSTSFIHRSLMQSAAHRENILHKSFARAGIGVMYGNQGLLVAQEFAA